MSNYLEYRRKLKLEGAPPKEKKIHKIRQVSKKRAVINRDYSEKSRPFWKGKDCRMKFTGCTGRAQGIHHIKGKVSTELLMDERYWIPACNHCNSYVEAHHAEAVKKGFKISRLKL